VFVVGCLGGWESAAKVLFESESLSGNIAKGRSSWKETSSIAGISTQLCGPLTARDYKGISSDDCNERYMKMVATPKIANCLETTCHDYSRADGFTMIAYENHPSDSRVKEMGETCQTVTSTWGMGGGNIPFVQNVVGFNTNARPDEMNFLEEQSNTLTASQNSGLMQNMAVRRLTEVECERLQGFPDNYTNIKENCPSGVRYKALGNSMAVPVMRWIGERINNYERI
jgi:DNA (cytosine-5)-methyltransferase 1